MILRTSKTHFKTHRNSLTAPLSGRCGEGELFQQTWHFVAFYAALLLFHLRHVTSVFQIKVEDFFEVGAVEYTSALDQIVLPSRLAFYNLYVVR